MTSATHRFRIAAILLSASGLACGDGRPAGGETPVYPIGGRATYRGRPLANALIAFEPISPPAASTPRSTGQCDRDGQFRLHTYLGDDGAPAGAYRVWVTPSPSAGPERRDLFAKSDKDTLTLPTLPARYADPATSGLTATVKADGNPPLTFDLD